MKRSVQLDGSSVDMIHIGDSPTPASLQEIQVPKDTRVVFSLSLALVATVTILIGVLMGGGALMFFSPLDRDQGVMKMLEKINVSIEDISGELKKSQGAIDGLTREVSDNQKNDDDARRENAKIIAGFDRDLADLRAELRMTQRKLGAGARIEDEELNQTKKGK